MHRRRAEGASPLLLIPALEPRQLTHAPCAQVWSIRVDVHFLDDEGNMLDCASIAAMTALRHFRKPDATVVGEEVTIVRLSLSPSLALPPRTQTDSLMLTLQHSMSERVPVALAVHHSPACLTFAFFGEECVRLPSLASLHLDPTSS